MLANVIVMERIFKHGRTAEVVNELKHARAILFKHPDAIVHVGTDSQNKRRHTVYATVIAFRYGSRGVHYIYHIERTRKIRDKWERLWKEIEMSVGVAEYLTENGIRVDYIDVDYNDSPKHYSNRLLGAAKGYCQGMGYRANVKPGDQPACRAADHLVN